MSSNVSDFIRKLKEAQIKRAQQENAEARVAGTRFSGVVEGIETRPDLYILDIHNGRGSITTCAVLFSSLAKHEYPILPYDFVGGYLNNSIEPLTIGDREVRAVVDFKNDSAAGRIPELRVEPDHKVRLETSQWKYLDPKSTKDRLGHFNILYTGPS